MQSAWSSCASRKPPLPVEDLVVRFHRRVKQVANTGPTIEKYMPPVTGPPELLYNGTVRSRDYGGMHIAAASGIPPFSTSFWRPDRPLTRINEAKRIRFKYAGPDGERSLVFVGFQDPPPEIPANTLLRVSLSRRWPCAGR